MGEDVVTGASRGTSTAAELVSRGPATPLHTASRLVVSRAGD
jgi:hypothetical protein